ncbi:hypothetical protein DPX16_21624 [Anabarilius grahami]|uniref:Uncharacterized protein n=1 Tax=Anabarilius grahami TaxID=495550 RepID=A0A3N0YKK2_ANAGA|nr:hypothetical protein DPX16_21624 [Anabarilius grahami]
MRVVPEFPVCLDMTVEVISELSACFNMTRSLEVTLGNALEGVPKLPACPVTALVATPNFSVPYVSVLPSQLCWLLDPLDPPWGSSSLTTLLWWSSALPWGSSSMSTLQWWPAPPWRSTRPSARMWWSSAPPWVSSSPSALLWWSSASPWGPSSPFALLWWQPSPHWATRLACSALAACKAFVPSSPAPPRTWPTIPPPGPPPVHLQSTSLLKFFVLWFCYVGAIVKGDGEIRKGP